MAFPSTLSTFSYPSVSDRLNSPSHSNLHNTVSSAVGQIETIIGLTGNSSTIGTLIGDLRSPGSDGGGHIQTANRGGTGQVTFNKGDILVAQSTSVLSKLSIGSDGKVLTANSSVATGIEWGNSGATLKPKLAVSGSVLTFSGAGLNSGENTVLSATIPGSTLGTNNALKAKLYVGYTQDNANSTLTTNFKYGTISFGTINTQNIGSTTSVRGYMEFDIIANNSINSQRGNSYSNLLRMSNSQSSVVGMQGFQTSVIGVNSDADQLLEITVTSNVNSAANIITTAGYIVEKIV